MCLLQCCYSCHLKAILDRMVPSCLKNQGQGESLVAAAGAEARQLTLEEMLYPPASWEMEAAAAGATPSRRNSPKVCPVNLHEFDDDDDATESVVYLPAANESVSVSVVSRASARSQLGGSRRVSFRSPDESDVFIIPARSDSDDESSDGKPSRM
ncbi:hypothetical protein BS78_07G180400 [Paspalum vaginatum]|uniref:Uncharacterized protein n=1 Tax=Paspalum vaginatum TaxID=158149 RepID=A0A9W7X834_9POAL|nr:hypothetical protein BS78_K295400 [Paspalum vaginatum]KAJ1269047.1 hypothetical protein BS78_07G180400 [Paspalum vaginatum]